MALIMLDNPQAQITALMIEEKFQASGGLYVHIQGQDPDHTCQVVSLAGKQFLAVFPDQFFGENNYMVFSKLQNAILVVNAWLFSRPVQLGDSWAEWINQDERFCKVIEIKRVRYRIEYEMPTCVQQGWRHGVRVCGRLFYQAGQPARECKLWLQ